MRSLEQLIEDQVARWSMERRRKRAEVKVERPIALVTISRQFGSRGSVIGEAIAERLEFAFWDQKLLHRMADEADADESALSWIDEQPRNAWSDFIDGILMGDKYTESEYLRRLIRVVRTLAEKGSSVIVGRGSQYILSAQSALRVRFVCPMELRIEGICGRQDLSAKKAERLIRRVDKERDTFMVHHYGRHLEDPSSFDLILNTGSLSEAQACELVVAAYAAQFGLPTS